MACLHQEEVLAVNADSTEFCPLETLRRILAVGTYELDVNSQTRHGLLYLYHLQRAPANCRDPAADSSQVQKWRMQRVQTFSMPGIFDMKWQPIQPARLLAACADGRLHVLLVHQAEDACQITRQQAVQVSDKAMAVSLDVSSSGQQVVSSLSDGSLSTLQVLLVFLKSRFHRCAFQPELAACCSQPAAA